MMIRPGDTVLFQGDSITDGGRDRAATGMERMNQPGALGQGYARDAAAMLLAELDPPGPRCINRGVGGDQVTGLETRWQADCLDLKPDVLSILVGINDTWAGTAKGNPENGTTLETYERVYRSLLDAAREQNPQLRLVLCEPFITQAGPVLELAFQPEVDHRRAIVKRLAAEYDAAFVPFQSHFDQAAKRWPPNELAGDGVHPTMRGHLLMARWWMEAVSGER